MRAHLIAISLWLGLAAAFSANAANSSTATRSAAAEELIKLIEQTTPKSPEIDKEWSHVADELRKAATLSETLQGFRLSAQSILSRWDGRGVRILDEQDATYYALHPKHPALHEFGVWAGRQGAKWHAIQVSHRPGFAILRGDALLAPDNLSPTSLRSGMSLRTLGHPLATPTNMTPTVTMTDMPSWALRETQTSTRALTLQGKRLCLERAWLWLHPELNEYLTARMQAAAETCDGLVLDLRNADGLAAAKALPTLRRRIPIAVLVNSETRGPAVALAQMLYQNWGAELIGEPTGSKTAPIKVQALAELPWLVLIYEDQQGSLIPKHIVRDDWSFAAGQDVPLDTALRLLKR